MDAGIVSAGIDLVDGCTYSSSTFPWRGGQVRNAEFRVDPARVDALLDAAGVPRGSQRSARDEYAGPWLLQTGNEMVVTERGATWQEGDAVLVEDVVEAGDQEWRRTISWGRDRDGDQ